MTWYLKKFDDSIYGPVDVATLKSWATTGRVAPEDHISEDRENWIYAANLDDLQMDWVLRFEDNTEYGPLHVLAIKQMVQDGDLDPATASFHRSSNEQRTAGEIALVVLFKLNRHLEESSTALADRLSHAEAELAKASETSAQALQAAQEAQAALAEQASQPPAPAPERPADAAQAMREWKGAREKLDKQQKETERWEARYTDLRQRTEKELGELRDQLKTAKRQAIQASTENEQLTIRLSQSAKRLATFQESGEGSSSGQLDSLTEAYNDLSSNYEVLMRQLSGKNEEIQGLVTSRSDAEHHAEQSIQEMSHRLHREQEEADAARSRFRELEETHLQLVKAYREMNDRYIQLRQNQGAVPQPGMTPASVVDDLPPAAKVEKKSGWKPKVRLTR